MPKQSNPAPTHIAAVGDARVAAIMRHRRPVGWRVDASMGFTR
jgi:hypothetical protein